MNAHTNIRNTTDVVEAEAVVEAVEVEAEVVMAEEAKEVDNPVR